MRGPSYTFAGVDVSLPSKVRGSEAEEEWQEVDWVTWSTGELTVDADSFLIVFKPSGSGHVKAKPLGALVRASLAGTDEGERTLVVTTSDALHRLYRLTFQSAENATEFARLAEQAEVAQSSEANPAAAADAKKGGGEGESELEAAVGAALAASAAQGTPPALLFGGAELCGPDPSFPGGGEVLLGRGVAALVDPADGSRVGRYELAVYGEDEGARAPVKKFTVGPKASLRRLPAEKDADPDAPAVIFELRTGVPGQANHSLSFESARIGEAFARDFRVRQRLMEVSLKTAQGARATNDLRDELQGMRQRSLCARLQRLIVVLVLLLVVAASARVAMLYREDKGSKAPAAYAAALADDAQLLMRFLARATEGAGARICELAVGSVPAEDIRRCLDGAAAAGRQASLRRCVELLVTPGVFA